MQPTMKLRWKQFQLGSNESHAVITPLNGTNRAFVLQQWWEEKKRIEGGLGSCAYEVTGEWRDIPIEVEP